MVMPHRQMQLHILVIKDSQIIIVATPLLEEYEDDTHTLEMGIWESFGTSETLEFDCRGQNTLP